MKNIFILIFCTIFTLLYCGCSNSYSNKGIDSDSIEYVNVDTISAYIDTCDISIAEEVKIEVPKFSIAKREREDYDENTPRSRYHVRTKEKYSEEQLELIADSLLRREREEYGINEIWVSYYLLNTIIDSSNLYGVSVRLRNQHTSTVFFVPEPRKLGYNPPKARDLSNANLREKQIWGAFDQGQIAGYEAGYKDGKRNSFQRSFNSSYPTSDEWIEQSYIQGYECGYLDGYDDAGGYR